MSNKTILRFETLTLVDNYTEFWENYTVNGKNLYLAAKSIHFPEATMRKSVARVENDSTDGMPALMRRGRTASPRISAAHTVFIERLLEEHGEYSLERIALLLQEEFPVDFETVISNSALHKHMRSKMDFTLKKAIIYPRRRNNPEIKLQRFNFINKIISEGIVRYNTNCIFVDETGFNLHINRTQARSRRGQPARIIVEPTSRGRNVTVFAAMSRRDVELIACHARSGSTNAEKFNDFIQGLIAHLNATRATGYHIIYDNAPIHTTMVENNLRDAGYVPLKLPPWSPFLNPIEEMFSKLKAGVKKHSLTSHDDLLARISQSSSQITQQDCTGWIGHSMRHFQLCLANEDWL
ncbi:hypothetical protein G6F46_007029 [Rhizopus delemar]|nr:hypothetical protein G6F54_002736 [Rhizopus delemar]KAG1628682.1 hypothetical protein G6F45_006754 [Rhizopus arrhizus]KAG1510339.1 hypothetical protein G6F53_006762 [Rhizopus delemar]KAG1595472.1 hypothetical protein G6F47_008488 [Rhizopus delemar]KAG1614346.1 hypothetical protein G6F46_007029 [Rhizopus delemar]